MTSKPTNSNFDLTGCKLVKRGSLVSWHGIRFFVSKVRQGVLYPDAAAKLSTKFFWCSEVQVVGQRPRNDLSPRSSASFKKSQSDLNALIARRVALRGGPACGVGPQREALPVGNTGITINQATPVKS